MRLIAVVDELFIYTGEYIESVVYSGCVDFQRATYLFLPLIEEVGGGKGWW